MQSWKSDFPLVVNHPELIYLDSAATAQKPAYVIEGATYYLEHDYANIHRGLYSLAQRSEDMYWYTKKTLAKWLNAKEEEIVFTGNSTGASNLIVQSLRASQMLKKGDKIILSAAEHHANVVPWQMIAEQIGCEIVFVGLDEERDISVDELERVWDSSVKIIACSYVSNVTGKIHRVKEIGKRIQKKRKEVSAEIVGEISYPFYIVDASQAVPHLAIDVQGIGCDMLYFTGHKIGAFTGIGVLWGKASLLRAMKPGIGGGAAVTSVNTIGYELQDIPDKFEPGTPNLVGIVSLLKAVEYLQKIGYEAITTYEQPLLVRCLDGFLDLESQGKLTLVGPKTLENRVGLFAFTLPPQQNPFQLGQYLADNGICMRVGGQCAQPLHQLKSLGPTCRISLWIYNDLAEIERFFEVLHTFLEEGREI